MPLADLNLQTIDPMSSTQPQSQPPDTSAHQTYYVVAADMSSFDGVETINCCQMVLASAPNTSDACDVARDALEEGMAPIAAFDREELLAMVDTLLHHPLQPRARPIIWITSGPARRWLPCAQRWVHGAQRIKAVFRLTATVGSGRANRSVTGRG